jgi:hypothetical protein
MNPKGAIMFNVPTNSRANRFNGTLPAFNRFAGAKVIGRGPKWRKGSKFDPDGSWRRPLDRNDRARVMASAEALERNTKRKHKRDGVLGQAALAVLRCLVNYFQNRHGDGRLDPSYSQIQGQTGFCRQTIAKAIKNLELAGILEIMRRIVRQRVRVWIEEAQRFFVYDRVVQTTNAYMVNFPLPARQNFGDLGEPLLRPEKYRPSKSTFSTEPTGDIIPRKENPLDPAVESALDSLEKSLRDQKR